jgi:hypothetical protein
MTEYTKDEALAFIGAIRAGLGDRVGFRWLVERLSLLTDYVESTATENELLNAYIDREGAREAYESFRAASSDEAAKDTETQEP